MLDMKFQTVDRSSVSNKEYQEIKNPRKTIKIEKFLQTIFPFLIIRNKLVS
jgi:hypothetical protein